MSVHGSERRISIDVSLLILFQDCGGGTLGGLSRRQIDSQNLDRNSEKIESLVVSKHKCSFLKSGKGMLKATAGIATHACPLTGVLSDVF